MFSLERAKGAVERRRLGALLLDVVLGTIQHPRPGLSRTVGEALVCYGRSTAREVGAGDVHQFFDTLYTYELPYGDIRDKDILFCHANLALGEMALGGDEEAASILKMAPLFRPVLNSQREYLLEKARRCLERSVERHEELDQDLERLEQAALCLDIAEKAGKAEDTGFLLQLLALPAEKVRQVQQQSLAHEIGHALETTDKEVEYGEGYAACTVCGAVFCEAPSCPSCGRATARDPGLGVDDPVSTQFHFSSVPHSDLPRLLQFICGVQPNLTYGLIEAFKCGQISMVPANNLRMIDIYGWRGREVGPDPSSWRAMFVQGKGFHFTLEKARDPEEPCVSDSGDLRWSLCGVSRIP